MYVRILHHFRDIIAYFPKYPAYLIAAIVMTLGVHQCDSSIASFFSIKWDVS